MKTLKRIEMFAVLAVSLAAWVAVVSSGEGLAGIRAGLATLSG